MYKDDDLLSIVKAIEATLNHIKTLEECIALCDYFSVADSLIAIREEEYTVVKELVNNAKCIVYSLTEGD